MRIAVIGGTGMLGAPVTAALRDRGHEVRVLTRHSEHPVDLTTGEGLEDALDGCDAVVEAANTRSPKLAEEVMVGGTRRILAAEQRVGVPHHLAISIVGQEAVPFGYYRAKVEQERLVVDGPVGWTLVRATQFHPFVADLLASAARLGVVPAPRFLTQPVDAGEVGAVFADAVEEGPEGRTITVAGPEARPLRAFVDEWRDGTGSHALRIPLRVPGGLGRALRDGGLVTDSPDVRGRITFRQWLAAQHSDEPVATRP
ncbi:uncharacterized protein YbjT (DUF2867 family) [Mumia flava]|uniref:Uncharacterized protein YbjT (DUF2867 family) n=1 Tax=Mumia flava TaxID=1348852 RepID=A0A0B2B2W0_9ACTN|nr:NAD(P)H-binding protein [Mumia flava]PJJ57815.1 uncharacterized protein YbjT (DUF2867 family) [Mumia flava]